MAFGIIEGGNETAIAASTAVKYDPIAKTLIQSDTPGIEEALQQTNKTVDQLSKKVDSLQSLHNQDTTSNTQAIAENKAAIIANAAAIDANADAVSKNASAIAENTSAINANAEKIKTHEQSLADIREELANVEINLRVGTEEERLAFANPYEGLEWNQTSETDGTKIVDKYRFENGAWVHKESSSVDAESELILFSFTSSDNAAVWAGHHIQLTQLEFDDTPQLIEINENGEAQFRVPLGRVYKIHYPHIEGYLLIHEEEYTAIRETHVINKTYQRFSFADGTTRSVILQQSNPEWATNGPEAIVDDILDTYGTYVIDEVHKKYAKLSPENHNFFLDGTAWNGKYGNAFRRFPRVYFKVENDEYGNPHLSISKQAFSSKFFEETWIGTYKGSYDANSRLRSIPNVSTKESQTMTQFWDAAQRLGTNYGLVNYFDHQLLNALHLTKYGNADSAQTMGPGLQDAGASYYNHITGYTAELGNQTGQMTYGTSSFKMNKLFGIEDLAGATWEFRPNIRFDGDNCIIYEGNIVSNTAEGIRTFKRLLTANNTYTSKMALGEDFDLIPTAANGSNSTYWCDGCLAASAGQLLLVGGRSTTGTLAGLSVADSSNAFSSSYTSIGARLAFRGNIADYELVNGAELAAFNETT